MMRWTLVGFVISLAVLCIMENTSTKRIGSARW